MPSPPPLPRSIRPPLRLMELARGISPRWWGVGKREWGNRSCAEPSQTYSQIRAFAHLLNTYTRHDLLLSLSLSLSMYYICIILIILIMIYSRAALPVLLPSRHAHSPLFFRRCNHVYSYYAHREREREKPVHLGCTRQRRLIDT